jgi:hypothetical protein
MRTSRNDVVQNNDLLPLLDCIALHLKRVPAVFFLKACSLCRAREFALLPHWYKTCSDSQCKAWPEKEAPCIKANDDVWLIVDAVSI